MPEQWKPVSGYESSYEVSDTGKVRSVTRQDTRGANRQGRELSQHVRRYQNGYETTTVALSYGNLVRSKIVSRLVAEAFLDPVEGKDMVLHWDGDGTNNDVSNLRWGDHNDNKADSLRLGEYGKLTDAQVAEIRSRDASCAQIGREFGVTAQYVGEIRRGLKRAVPRETLSDAAVDNGAAQEPAEPGAGAPQFTHAP